VKTPRKSIVTILVVMLFLMSVSSAFSEGQVTVTQEFLTGTVNWSMSPAQCAELDATLSGTGERHAVIITRVDADGTTTIRINDVIHGTASDSTGTYRFAYNNESTETFAASGGSHAITMVDTFLLNGDGNARLNVGFNWRWTYTPPASLWPPADNWEAISTRGDPLTCDPL
jgi:hypothetical protein